MQLIAGSTAKKYNIRKARGGGYWEDRYHATAVESGDHLLRCMIYIDLNMVRTGVVRHPKEWADCGYHEIFEPRTRYKILDQGSLLACLKFDNQNYMRSVYAQMITEALNEDRLMRDDKWTTSIAVGEEVYVNAVKEELKPRMRRVESSQIDDDAWGLQVRESESTYGEECLSFFWDDLPSEK